MKKEEKKTLQKRFLLALAALVTAGSVAACRGASSAAGNYMAMETTAASFDMAAGDTADGWAGGAENGWDGGAADSASRDMGFPAALAAPETAAAETYKNAALMEMPEEAEMEMPAEDLAAPAGGSGIANLQNANRKLIRTVNLDVETTGFDALLESIRQAVTEDGGYIESSDVSGTSMVQGRDQRRYAYLTVRVPSKHLDVFLSQVSEESNVTNRSENVQDVTLQYTDIESRKKSLTIEQERLWELLEKADTLEAVIALESRLSEIRYQLESMESQLRTYDNQVDYSTVYMSIREVGVFTPTEPDSVAVRIQKGFARNLQGVSNGLVDFFVFAVSHLPALGVLAVAAAVAVLAVRLLGRLIMGKNGKEKKGSRKKFFRKPRKETAGQAEAQDNNPAEEDNPNK